MGIMEEIKQHLESGKTVKELKELGFKAPSIYKVKKSLKDKEPPEVKEDPEPGERSKPFQKKVEEVPGTVLAGDNPGPNNTNTNIGDLPNNQEEEGEGEGEGTKGEPLIEELFSDDEKPFQDFNEVDINRNHIDIPATGGLSKSDTKTPEGEGKLGLSELIAQVYSLIGITTNHEHWEVTSKEQKVLKHLCKIPALEKALHRFGLYGCVISLVTMTLKRIKIEMQLRKEGIEYEDEMIDSQTIVQRPDAPSNIMEIINEK